MPAPRLILGLLGLSLTAAYCAANREPALALEETAFSRGTPETPRERAQRLLHLRDSDQRRRAFEIEHEQRARPPALLSGCGASADPGRPQLCLRLLDRRAITKGSGLRYRVEWRNLPTTLGLIVVLERAAPIGEHYRYRGVTGPLHLSTIPVSGSGSVELAWNGREVGCAPADGPTWCDGVEIGAYRLGATVVDWPDYHFLGWPDRRPYRLHLWTRSDEFAITGPFDMRSILNEDRREVTAYLRERLGYFQPIYDWSERGRPLPARRVGDAYCADKPMRPPLRGALRICVGAAYVDRYGVSARPEDMRLNGDIAYLPGLIAQDRAEAIARRTAMRGYEGAADYLGHPGLDAIRALPPGAADRMTFLDTSVAGGAYRGERGGYWLFIVEQKVSSLSGSGPRGPWHRLLIKVEPDGTACRIGRGTMDDFRPSIGADGPPGGLEGAQARRYYDPERWQLPCPRSR